MSAREILDNLGQLTPAQLREVQARTTALLGGTQARQEAPTGDRDEVRLHAALEALGGVQGLRKVPPLGVLRKGPLGRSFREGSQTIAAYILDVWGKQRELKKRKLTDLLLGILLDWILSGPAPVSLKALVENLHQVPALMDEAFPGYKASGLLPLVLERV